MKKTIFFSVLLISLLSITCSDSIVDDNVDEGVNFFLLKDSAITASEVVDVNLNKLILADKPIISYKDLVNYNWSTHSFEIGESKANEIKNYCLKNISVRGIPFVVTVDKERIYLGSFWASYSSIAPTFPNIEAMYLPNQTKTILSIRKSWNENEQDLRNDQRIYNSLKKYGLLILD